MNIEHNNQKIWTVFDEMRNAFNTSESKTRILALLMLKYLSDNAMQGKVGKLTVPEESRFERLFESRDSGELSLYIDKALRAFEQANQESVSDALSGIVFDDPELGDQKKRNDILRTMIIELNSPILNFRNHDVNYAGSAFEFALGKFADIEKKDVDFTPFNISYLMAELARGKAKSIHDPACGTGMLLLKTAHANESEDIQLSGQELDETNIAISVMNAIVHGYDACDIRPGNTLLHPQFTKDNALQKFSCIVSYPPLIQKDWTKDDDHKEYNVQEDPFNRYRRGIPPKTRSDWAFLSHIIESLDAKGRAFVIVPQGALYRSSSAESHIRANFIKEQLIEAIINLPTNTLHGTYIAPAIMILAKNNRKKTILFIDAASQFKKEKFRNVIGEQAIKDIAAIYHDYVANTDIEKGMKHENASVISLEEIMEHEYSLSMSEYAPKYDDNPTMDLAEIRKQIALKQEAYHAIQKERIALMKKLEKRLVDN